MIRFGTCYFPTLQHACSYYAQYGSDARDVADLVADGGICLGAPPLLPGQRLVLVDDGLRYAIEEDV